MQLRHSAPWLLALVPCALVDALLDQDSALRSGGDATSAAQAPAQPEIAVTGPISNLRAVLQRFDNLADDSLRRADQLDSAPGGQAQAASVQEALGQSAHFSAQSLNATRRIYENMKRISASVQEFLGPAQRGCDNLRCGMHASCSETDSGPQCVCNEGFIGLGSDCHAPPQLLPHPLLPKRVSQVEELGISMVGDSHVVVVFRDAARQDSGWMVLCTASDTGPLQLGFAQRFTPRGVKAYNPVVTGTESSRLTIAWRDEPGKGKGWLRGAAPATNPMDAGVEQGYSWGEAFSLDSWQANKMALVSLPQDRVAVLYSDVEDKFGGALLAKVEAQGAVVTLRNFRFLDAAVARLEVAKVSPSSFVVAMRAGPIRLADSEEDIGREAVALFGEVIDDTLSFDSELVNLAPQSEKVWARGVALIAPNTVAYAYQDGGNQSTNMAVLEVSTSQAPGSEDSSRLRVVQRPVIVDHRLSRHLQLLSVPYSESDPHTVMCQEHGSQGLVSICSWDAQAKELGRCENFPWIGSPLRSAAGVVLADGRVAAAVSTPSGTPYLSLFNLAKK